MVEWIQIGGWVMIPIIACSVVALAVIFERAWALRQKRVIPKGILNSVERAIKKKVMDAEKIERLERSSHLGHVMAAALANRHRSRAEVKDSIEDNGRHVVIKLEKHLNMLGTIAAITPLLGLLGTVIGMIKVFTVLTIDAASDPSQLAGGISEALITTAAGLCVAIPSLMFYRYFERRVDELVVIMEQESLKLLEIMFAGKK